MAGLVSLVLALVPMSLAGLRTVPNAVRLGQAVDSPTEQLARARSILRDHRWCIASIAVLVTMQLVHA